MPNLVQPFDLALHNIFCSHVAPWKKSLPTPDLDSVTVTECPDLEHLDSVTECQSVQS